MHPTRPRVLLCPDGRGALWEAEVNEHGTGGTARMLMEERKHRWISVELVPPACDVGYAVVMNEVGNQNAGCSLFRIHGLGGDAPVLEQPAVIPDSPWMRSAIVDTRASPTRLVAASASTKKLKDPKVVTHIVCFELDAASGAPLTAEPKRIATLPGMVQKLCHVPTAPDARRSVYGALARPKGAFCRRARARASGLAARAPLSPPT